MIYLANGEYIYEAFATANKDVKVTESGDILCPNQVLLKWSNSDETHISAQKDEKTIFSIETNNSFWPSMLREARTKNIEKLPNILGIYYPPELLNKMKKKFILPHDHYNFEELIPDLKNYYFEVLDNMRNTDKEQYDNYCKENLPQFYFFENFVAPFINFDDVIHTYSIKELKNLKNIIETITPNQINRLLSNIDTAKTNTDVLKRVNRVPKYIDSNKKNFGKYPLYSIE